MAFLPVACSKLLPYLYELFLYPKRLTSKINCTTMELNKTLAALRIDYAKHALDESEILAEPIAQFQKWFQEALNAEVEEPNGMTLATIDHAGWPQARIVLLKGVSENGFTFYTNYESQKGQDLNHHPRASLVFWWKELHRQVRILGTVSKLSDHESTAYFQSRPKGSQIGAWASAQSSKIDSRQELEKAYQDITLKYQHDEVLPRPPYWGGYLVKPRQVEFWQGRSNRLHDRIVFQSKEDNNWEIIRLAS